MDEIRAFIAVTLPDGVRQFLSSLQNKVKAAAGGPVKWVELENFHLTLAFLGNTPPDTVPGILDAMKTAVRGVRPFTVNVTGLGVFPNPRKPQVVWAGLEGGVAALGRLQRELGSELEPLGFTPDRRPFRPHLTLGRVRDSASPAEREGLGKTVAGLAAPGGRSFTVDTLHLIRSELNPGGPVYTVLGSTPLR